MVKFPRVLHKVFKFELTLEGIIVIAAAQSGDNDSDAIAEVEVLAVEVPTVAEVLLELTTFGP